MPLQPSPDFRDAESTSAALARVERERQQALEDLAASEHAQHHVERERDELVAEVERLVDLGGKAMRERDLARAELASAQQELARLRDLLQAGRNAER